MTENQRPSAKPRRPEKLVQLNISGFRSIRKLDLSLGDRTILIGPNGAGKSNLVAVFNLLSSLVSERLQLYIQTRAGASSILHYGPKVTPSIHAGLTFASEAGTSTYSFSLGFASPDRLVFVQEDLEFRRAGESKAFQRTINRGGAETNLAGYARAHDSTSLRKTAQIFLQRLDGLRVYHFHDTSDTAQIRLTQDLANNRMLHRNGANLAAFLYMLRQRHPAHYDRILATVRLVVPYLRELVLEPDLFGNNTILLRWRDRSTDHEFGAHQLSDGSLRAIALVTALLQPEEFLPALIAIDEPELGLHPSAVTNIAHLIQAVSTKRQILIATQSPRLIADFAPEDVVVVERDEDASGRGSSTFQRLSAEALGTWRERYDLGQLYEMNVTGGGPR